MRHDKLIFAALLVAAFIAPVSALAQEALPVVVIENPGGDSEVRRPADRALTVPRRLGWSAVLNSVDVVLELYGVACCDPPPQFTLTPARLAHLRNGKGGALHLLAVGDGYGFGVYSYERRYGPYVFIDHPGAAIVELIDLKPDYQYVLDIRILGGGVPFYVAGTVGQSSSTGHVLAIVTTDPSGDAWVTLDKAGPTRDNTGTWTLFDVVVSELQPAR